MQPESADKEGWRASSYREALSLRNLTHRFNFVPGFLGHDSPLKNVRRNRVRQNEPADIDRGIDALVAHPTVPDGVLNYDDEIQNYYSLVPKGAE